VVPPSITLSRQAPSRTRLRPSGVNLRYHAAIISSETPPPPCPSVVTFTVSAPAGNVEGCFRILSCSFTFAASTHSDIQCASVHPVKSMVTAWLMGLLPFPFNRVSIGTMMVVPSSNVSVRFMMFTFSLCCTVVSVFRSAIEGIVPCHDAPSSITER